MYLRYRIRERVNGLSYRITIIMPVAVPTSSGPFYVNLGEITSPKGNKVKLYEEGAHYRRYDELFLSSKFFKLMPASV